MFSQTEATRCHQLAHRHLPGSFCQSDLVLEASWGTWCSGGSRHSRQPSLHSLPLTSWCWRKTSLNLPSQWANLTSLGQGFKLLRSFCHRTENRKLLLWSLWFSLCQSQVALAMVTVTVSQVKTPKTGRPRPPTSVQADTHAHNDLKLSSKWNTVIPKANW